MPFSLKPPPKASKECLADALRARSAANGLSRLIVRRLSRRPGRPGSRKKFFRRLSFRFLTYFYKMRGSNQATHAFSLVDTLWSFGGAFIGMIVLAAVNVEVWGRAEQGLLLGSFGASAMLVFGAPHAPYAQPRNVVGGHIISALIGVAVQQVLGTEPWLAAALAVALSVSAMHVTATLHPPGGATSLLAVVGSSELKRLGFTYALYPVGVSMLVMVLVGVMYNNLCKRRHYPVCWW